MVDVGRTGSGPLRIPPPPPRVPKADPAFEAGYAAGLAAAQAGAQGRGTGNLPAVQGAAPASGFKLGSPPNPNESDADFVRRVFWEELGRDPGKEGLDVYGKHLANGLSREAMREAVANSEEARNPETKTRKAWVQSMIGSEGKDPVETIKNDPRYGRAQLDMTSLQTATESATKYVLTEYKDLVDQLQAAHNAVPENKQKARQLGMELTGHLIGVLRANGIDAQRLVRQSHNDFGNPNRYVNDAFVLPDGRAIDWLGGEGTEGQFHDLDVPSPKTDRNFGVVPLEPGMRLSSSTLGI